MPAGAIFTTALQLIEDLGAKTPDEVLPASRESMTDIKTLLTQRLAQVEFATKAAKQFIGKLYGVWKMAQAKK